MAAAQQGNMDEVTVSDSEAPLVVSNCSFDGFVLGNSRVGGIVGSDSKSMEVKEITNCLNTGLVFGRSNGVVGAGGILGSTSTVPTTYIENCFSAGKVIVNGYNCGAIVGLSTAGNGYNRNCYYVEASAVDGKGVVQNGVGVNALGASLNDCDGETDSFSSTVNISANSDNAYIIENLFSSEYLMTSSDTSFSAHNG